MVEPDSSSRTVPARGQGRPVTGDQDGEGREMGQKPTFSVALFEAGLFPIGATWPARMHKRPRHWPVHTKERADRPFFCSPTPTNLRARPAPLYDCWGENDGRRLVFLQCTARGPGDEHPPYPPCQTPLLGPRCPLLPGSDRKRTAMPYRYRISYRNPEYGRGRLRHDLGSFRRPSRLPSCSRTQ